MVGVATLMKSAGVKNHLHDLNWSAFPEGGGQTVQNIQGDHGSQTQPSARPELQAQSASNTIESEERPRSSVLEEDLSLSNTHDNEGEDKVDGGQSSTDQDISGYTKFDLSDRLHVEETGENVLSESSMFTASLGNGNHRRETLDPPSVISHQSAVDAVGIFSRPVNDVDLNQPSQVKPVDKSSIAMCGKSTASVSRTNLRRDKKKHHNDTGEGIKRTRKFNLKDQEVKGLHTPRTSRRSVREPPSNTSTPRPVSNSDDFSVKCEYCGKRLLKKSMKYHVKKIHKILDKLLECRKCGTKFLREAARDIHETSCVINYEVCS